MTWTLSRKLKACFRPFALFVLVPLSSQIPQAAHAQIKNPNQHFVCYVGYTVQQCAAAMTELRKVLTKYPVDALGEWTWVLVRTEDLRRILLERGLDPERSPAFSILTERVTLFEGTLVTRTSSRGVQLRQLWRMPIEDLLDLAIRHELAHALCNERDEAKADRVARLLHTGQAPTCEVQLAASSSRQPKGQR